MFFTDLKNRDQRRTGFVEMPLFRSENENGIVATDYGLLIDEGIFDTRSNYDSSFSLYGDLPLSMPRELGKMEGVRLPPPSDHYLSFALGVYPKVRDVMFIAGTPFVPQNETAPTLLQIVPFDTMKPYYVALPDGVGQPGEAIEDETYIYMPVGETKSYRVPK